MTDPQQSKGSTVTFTERWCDFQAGAGPPPAPQLAQCTAFAATAAMSANFVSRSRPGALAVSTSSTLVAAGSPTAQWAGLSTAKQLNRQFFPMLSLDPGAAPNSRPRSADATIMVSC